MRPKRAIAGRLVHPVGLGAMNLSDPGAPSRDEAIAVIHAALDAGMELIDTADVYAPSPAEIGHNERLVADALAGWPGPRPLVATKGGVVRDGERWSHDGRPAHLRRACEASLARLAVDHIDLYYLHAVDAGVPIEESAGELERLRVEGKVSAVGLSNVDGATVARALRETTVVAVQNEASPYRPEGLRDGVLALCESNGLAFVSHSPMGGFRAGGTAHIACLREVADEVSSSPFEVVIAWLLGASEALVAIPGASRSENARSSARAAGVRLSAGQRSRIDAVLRSPAQEER